MKNLCTLVTAATAFTLSPSLHAQLVSDDFESYTVGNSLNTSGPWGTVQLGGNPVVVRDETTDTPFGTPNQYLDHVDNSSGSIRIQTPNLAAASGVVTTLAFDFEEPSTGGGNAFIFGYTITNGDLTGAGARIMPNLDDGAIGALSTTGTNTYSLDTPYRLFVVFNDTDAPIDYLGGPLAAGVADLWIQPVGGSPVFAGTRNGQNSQTSSYRIGFRAYGSNQQSMLIDNVVLHEGIAVPGAVPTALSTLPADDATGVLSSADLVVEFDMPIFAGTGNITVDDGSSPVTYDIATSPDVSISGSTLTIKPPTDLALSTAYSIQIDDTAIVNVLGEPYAGISTTTEWNFVTSADATPPSLLTLNPADDATGVPLGANLVATFDEDVVAVSGNIVITNLTESSTFATIPVGDAQVSIVGPTVTINPDNDLLGGRNYAVEIDAGAIADTTGNPFAGISGTADWNFATIPDTVGPTLVSTTPGDNSAKASIFNDLVASFDEPIQAGTGNVVIKNLTDATTFATYDIGDPEITITGDQLIINYPDSLDTGTDHAIQIDAGAITDFSSNAFAGILDDTTWNFLTSRLSSRDHINGDREASAPALGYYADSSSNVVGVSGAGGAREHRSVIFGLTLPTLPVGQTAGSVDFEFEILAARDTTGAANLPDLQVYLLDTVDPEPTGDGFFYQPASEGDVDPSADAALVTTTSVTVSGTGENTFADDSEDRVVTLTGDALTMIQSFYGGDHIPDQPEAFFRFNLDETIAINTYRRYRIDVSSGEVDLQVTGFSTAPPALTATFPVDDSTAVSQSSSLSATFDLPIQIGSGDITIKNLTDATTFATIPVGDAQVTISGDQLLLDPTGDLDPAKEYAIQLAAGVVESAIGTPILGVLDDTTWSFTTGTSVAGALASNDSIVGRSQSSGPALNYYANSGVRQVGAGGATGARSDRNVVLGFTLPTLPVGSTFGAANLDFEITAFRRISGTSRSLDVYLIDSTNPNSTGTALFYHGPADPNPDAEFVGSTTLTAPNSTQITYADDEQDQRYALTGDALALLQSFYGGDHIPERSEVFFRFNLDTLAPGTGDGGLEGVPFDRYFIDFGAAESSLDVVSVGGAVSAYDTWASDNGLSGGDALDAADVESDGLVNLLEFGFGTDPSTADNGPLVADGSVNGTPIIQHSGGGGGVTFDALFVRRDDHGTAGSVTYTPQFSSDLVTFYDSVAVPTFVLDSTDDPDYEVVSVPYPATLPDGKKARFFRMKVDLVP